MDHFVILPDQTLPIPRIVNHPDPSILCAVLQNHPERIPPHTVFYLKDIPEYGLPDVIFVPLLLMSELFINCVRIYHPYQKAMPVSLQYRGGTAPYYILSPLEGDAESEAAYERHICETIHLEKARIKISLDLAESLLRREAYGFSLVPI